MCTIIIVNHHHKEFPLLIAANRDEDYKRPSSAVQVLAREPLLIMGGKDDLKGGTWLGVNKNSLFVGITNQGTTNPKLESRGHLVLNALKCKTLEELLEFVESINPAKYSHFNIVFGNNKHIFLGHSYILHSMVIKELPKGVHMVSNDMKFIGDEIKPLYIHKRLDHVVDMPWLDYYKLLKKILASSDNGLKIKPKKSKDGTIHGFCTRSSSILAFSEDGLVRYKFHDRTAERPKKKEGEPTQPRYKDYIDIWRNPDGLLGATSLEHSEENDDVEDEISHREDIKEAFMKLVEDKSIRSKSKIKELEEWKRIKEKLFNDKF